MLEPQFVHKSIKVDFLRSALTFENPFQTIEGFFVWFEAQKQEIHHRIVQIPFSEMEGWRFDEKTTNLVHNSGKFFSIEGINVRTNWGRMPEWSQPIINQSEIGLLGILVKKIDGVLYFLMQAKIEPGNINYVQLSPTLQATKSNYSRVHKGASPPYLDYFLSKGHGKRKVLLDQLQSEQGARFLRKRNRNIIVEIDEDIEILDNFCWLTLGQIKELLKYDNVVNMDTRTVISGIPFGDYPDEVISIYEGLNITSAGVFEQGLLRSVLENDNALHEIEDVISWITEIKSVYELEVNRIPLASVRGWQRNDMAIFHEQEKYFSVIAMKAEIGSREVKSWTQPLVKSAQEGIIAFIVKKIDGVYHFLVQAKLEAGNLDIIELAPTVQCLTGNYRKGVNEYDPTFLDDILNMKEENVRYTTFQSEEGGRFFQEQNKNIIVEVDDDFPIEVPYNFCWMTLNQLSCFIKFNNYLNIQARSLLSAIRFI